MKSIIKIKTWLSHHPFLYALIGGVGLILFWRGVWLTMDFLMSLLKHDMLMYGSINMTEVWWDGPLSILLGTSILSLTSAFVSSLIGNEIIISGLRAEKNLFKKESMLVKEKTLEIEEIRHNLSTISSKLDEIEHTELHS